jgi:mediator of RNA polymerase II transcription subunit 23
MFSQTICQEIVELFFKCRFKNEYKIEIKQFAYWINAAGLLIANMPDSYWQPIYERIAQVMLSHSSLNQTDGGDSNLLDSFDLYLADEKNCFNEVSLIIALFHSIWCHSSANHFQYFVKFIKERRNQLVKTEAHFLFICKLIGPFLSKIHLENTNLLIMVNIFIFFVILILFKTYLI